MRILFVCLGNICRSPTAEGVMRKLVAEAGLDGRAAGIDGSPAGIDGPVAGIELDSAGTGDWHVGEAPDPRAKAAAKARGIELDSVARQVRRRDFEDFDLILAMDGSNLHDLRQLAPDEAARAKVRLLREFDPASHGLDDLDVPDPYYDSERGFQVVLDQIEAACAGLLEAVRAGELA